MKGQAIITDTAPDALFRAFRSRKFAVAFTDTIKDHFVGTADVARRPAEFYVQYPDRAVPVEDSYWGLEFRLTGVSRNGRPAKIFHSLLYRLEDLVAETAIATLAATEAVHIFVVLMLDGDVETAPGSGRYSSVLESESRWVHGLLLSANAASSTPL